VESLEALISKLVESEHAQQKNKDAEHLENSEESQRS